MKRFSLRLSEAEYIKLKLYCEELHVSMNDVVRELIRNWKPKIKVINNSLDHKNKCG
ncbi:MAG: ribbon-helix-helix protein, CopG family [Cyanobacteria bacterium P01_G01_bin.67]